MNRKDNKNLIVFIRQLSLVIDSDISIFEGLELISNKTDSEYIKKIVKKTLENLYAGESLASSLEANEDIPAIVKSMINIGEESGDLSFSLNEVANSLEKDDETLEKLKQAVTYPIILTVLMTGVILLLIVKILPMFNEILESLGGHIPVITLAILNISMFLSNNIWIILAFVIAIIVGLIVYFKSEKGRYKRDKLKLYLPLLKEIYSALLAVRFSRNLSMLYKAGIPVNMSFSMISPSMNNLYVEKLLAAAKDELDMGAEPDKVIEGLNIFPWVLVKLFSVAQNTGHMEEILLRASKYMEEEANSKIQKLTSVLEPILIIVLSVIMGLILVSVMIPVINIMNTIG